MSNVASTDILQVLSLEKWPVLQNKLKFKWPTYAYYYYWIENSIKWKKKDPNISIQIYCPDENDEDATFIGISNVAFCMVIVCTLNPNSQTLYTILTETKVIDWNQPIHIATVHGSIAPIVLSAIENLKNLKKIGKEEVFRFNYYYKPAEECTNTEIRIPDKCYLKPLEESDVPLIHSIWPHRNLKHPELSTRYLSTLIKMNGGMGLYLKEDNSLVSWAMQNDWHGLAIVQTVDKHKRNGYAKSIVKILSKKLGEDGISVVLFIAEGNTASELMFKDLGWRSIAPLLWIMFEEPQSACSNN